MKPIVIRETTEKLTIKQLRAAILNSASKFLHQDFNDYEKSQDIISDLEEYVIEALLRLCVDKFGYKPLQNKLYEKVEIIFAGDHYNINRTISILRRSKDFAIDANDEKYISWVNNRIKYATKSIRNKLASIDYSLVAHD